jgi:hypothetical protein
MDEFDPYEDAHGQFAWGPDPEEEEAAAAVWEDDEW